MRSAIQDQIPDGVFESVETEGGFELEKIKDAIEGKSVCLPACLVMMSYL